MKLRYLVVLMGILFLLAACDDAMLQSVEDTAPLENSETQSQTEKIEPYMENESPKVEEIEDSSPEDSTPEESNSSLSALTEPNWRESYADYLNEADFLDFYVGDINCDGIPEVVTRYHHDTTSIPPYEDYTNSGEILSFTDNDLQVFELFVASGWGKVGFLEQTNQIICLQWYGHTYGTFGSVDFFIYEWTSDGYTTARSVIRKSGYYSSEDGTGVYGQGYVNGEEVGFDEFEIALAEMYALLEKSTWFPMIDADEVEDYLDYFIEWEHANNSK